MEKLGIDCRQLMTEEIKHRLGDADNIFITSFAGMGVGEQEELRRKLRESDAYLFVTKNSLVKRGFRELEIAGVVSVMQGLTALVLGGGDVISVSKALVGYARTNDKFNILGAYVDKQFLDPDSVKTLAAIPSKETLQTQIVCAMIWPIQGLVNSISGVLKSLAIVLDNIRRKQAEEKDAST